MHQDLLDDLPDPIKAVFEVDFEVAALLDYVVMMSKGICHA